MKDCIELPPQRESHNRISQLLIRNNRITHVRFPCLVGEGWGGGWFSDARDGPLARYCPTPTPDPSPQGGGEKKAQSVP